MNIEKFSIQSCCGSKSVIFRIDRSIDSQLLAALTNLGYKEYKHFTEAGILYVDNSDLIITGPIGSNKLQIKCKNRNCDQKITEFEALLASL